MSDLTPPVDQVAAESDGPSGSDNGRVGWGIGLLAVAGGIAVGAILTTHERFGDLVMIYAGVGLIGTIQALRGWPPASRFWRAGAVTAIVVIGAYAFWAVHLSNQRDEELSADLFNAVKVGDCVDGKGFVVSCDSVEAESTVTRVIRYTADDTYPAFDAYDRCQGRFFYPKPWLWEAGGRTVKCVK